MYINIYVSTKSHSQICSEPETHARESESGCTLLWENRSATGNGLRPSNDIQLINKLGNPLILYGQ